MTGPIPPHLAQYPAIARCADCDIVEAYRRAVRADLWCWHHNQKFGHATEWVGAGR